MIEYSSYEIYRIQWRKLELWAKRHPVNVNQAAPLRECFAGCLNMA